MDNGIISWVVQNPLLAIFIIMMIDMVLVYGIVYLMVRGL